MGANMSQAGRALQLEDLAVLNQELAALVRAGLPLDAGLVQAAEELGGGAGKLAARLAERLARGESLREALEGERALVPPLYRAVVAAGERSGDLATALASVSDLASRMRALRANTGLALVYPLLVCLVASVAWTLWSTWLFPAQIEAARELRVTLPGAVVGVHRMLQAVHRLVPLPVFPGLLVLGVLIWWRRSGRTSLLAGKRAARLLAWVPWAGKVVLWSRQAVLAETLALLLEHGVPADEALTLAAEAAGGGEMADEAALLAAQIRRGQALSVQSTVRIPALAAWALVVPQGQAGAVRLLHAAGDRYRRWAESRLSLARVALPYVLLVCFLAPLVMAYTVSVFGPTVTFMEQVAEER